MKPKDHLACALAIAMMLVIIFIFPNHDDDFARESFFKNLSLPIESPNWIVLETSRNQSYVLVNDIEHEVVKYDREKIERIIADFEAKKGVKVENHVVDFFPNETRFFFRGVFLEHKSIK